MLYKKFEKNGIVDINKQSVYIDVDDVILNSSVTVIDLLNEKYQIAPPKTIDNLKDWGMRSIKRNLTKEEIIRFYDSDDFWSNVEVNSIFLKWLDDDSLFKSYNWICFTKGTVKNLQRKYEFLQKVFQEYGRGNFLSYIGIHDSEKKTNLRMFDGIQIDDRIDNLANSDARLKILVKNHLDTNYNSKIEEQEILGNLYVTNDLSDVEDILRFNLINKL